MYYKAYHKMFYIKTFDFDSIIKTKQVDCDHKFLQQVVWTGSSQHDRASKLHIKRPLKIKTSIL